MATYHVDPQRDPLAASSDLRRRLFGGRRRRRHAGVPLPITLSDDRNAPAMAAVHASILEDVVHYTLSNLHNIQKSLLYWKSRARATNLQRLYFVVFERGPRAFLQTARQTLGSKTPSQDLLSSSASIISTRLHALTSMQDCLAAFLTELYSEVEGRLTDISSDQSLRALFAVLNTVFLKLELSLENHIFQRLPEVDDVEVSTATSLIYENLLRLDAYISEKELNRTLEGSEIMLALCAALPAFGLCLLLLLLLRKDGEERGKMSRLPQRLLLRDAELRLAEFRKCLANGMEEKANSKFGLMLCELDRLYKAVESHARKTGEWQCVREDIADLAKPGMAMEDRLVVLSRLKEMYYCLLPSPSPPVCYPPSL
uniref:Uncharacterized protein n=1 Tax=Avena sativa TaxID=4498 RepID=A0ACD5ZIH7_AVESA